MEKLFKLKENGTSARTEVLAGITTFMTMAYIIALNPNLLTNWRAGGDELWNAVFLATCIASGIAMVCMAFLANKPFCLAPGMGLNSFFALVVTQVAMLTGATYVASFQAALVIVLAEGIVFLALTLCNVRERIVASIPTCVRLGITPALGLMLLNIALGSNAGVMNSDGGMFYALRDFFGALTPAAATNTMGDAFGPMVVTVLTMLIGLFAIALFTHRGLKGAVLWGMLAATAFYWICEVLFLGIDPFANLAQASWVPAFGDLADLTLFNFNFEGFFALGWATAASLIITLCMIDMFDTIGALLGTAQQSGMMEKDGSMPWMKGALASDAIGTVLGIVMLGSLGKVHWHRIEDAVPIALMMIAMPVSGSIGHAIGLGLISFSVLNICTGQASRKYWLTYALSVLFLASFFLVV